MSLELWTKEKIHLLGAGALGLGIVAGLGAELCPQVICAFNRSRLFRKLHITSDEDPNWKREGPLHCHHWMSWPEAIERDLTNGLGVRIIICVPVACGAQAWTFALNTLLRPKIREEIVKENRSVSLWFCGNGVFPAEAHELSRLLPVSVCRAIFFAGFQSSWEASTQTLSVRHTGGRRAFFGSMNGPLGAEQKTGRDFLKERFLAKGCFFEAEEKEEIVALEWQKAFVNAILAWVIGPCLLPNRALSELVSRAELRKLALEFAGICPVSGLNPQILLDRLEETLAQTGSNINSVSSSWAAGDPESAFSFRQLIRNAALECTTPGCKTWETWFCRHELRE